MDTIVREVILSSLGPAVLFVASVIAARRVLDGSAHSFRAERALFALAFAAGQFRILGELSWPPVETSQSLPYLAFFAVVSGADSRASMAFLVLNVGAYFALHPIWAESAVSATGQWAIAQVSLWAALGAFARVPPAAPGWLFAGLFAALGVVFVASASTSLAMTAFLLANLSAAQAILWRPWMPPVSIIQPVFVLLLSLELYNYVW